MYSIKLLLIKLLCTLNKKFSEELYIRNRLIKSIAGKDPIIMNVTITSDIIKYNNIYQNTRSCICDTKVKQVSTRQSFVYTPSTTNVN